MLKTSEIHNLELKTSTVIRLTGLSACGYLWQYDIDHPSIIEVKHAADPYEKIDYLGIGSSLDEIFSVSGIGVGTATIKFAQIRPWMDEAPYATHLVKVTVI